MRKDNTMQEVQNRYIGSKARLKKKKSMKT